MGKEFPENSAFLSEIAKYGFLSEWIKVLQEIRSEEEIRWPLTTEDLANYRNLSADERELVFFDSALSRPTPQDLAEDLEVLSLRKTGKMRQKELIGKIGRQRVIELLGEDKLNRIEE